MARVRKDRVSFHPDMNTVRKVGYRSVRGLTDDDHVYFLSWRETADRDGLSSGSIEGLSRDQLLEEIDKLGSDNFLTIQPRTLNLGKARREAVISAHSDERRAIYDPTKVLSGLRGKWYPHNIMHIRKSDTLLGNHHHDYTEVFFVPGGTVLFALIDPKEPKNPRKIGVYSGDRLVIPAGIDHAAIGSSGSVMMAYGSKPFDPSGLIASNEEVRGTLSSVIMEDVL